MVGRRSGSTDTASGEEAGAGAGRLGAERGRDVMVPDELRRGAPPSAVAGCSMSSAEAPSWRVGRLGARDAGPSATAEARADAAAASSIRTDRRCFWRRMSASASAARFFFFDASRSLVRARVGVVDGVATGAVTGSADAGRLGGEADTDGADAIGAAGCEAGPVWTSTIGDDGGPAVAGGASAVVAGG